MITRGVLSLPSLAPLKALWEARKFAEVIAYIDVNCASETAEVIAHLKKVESDAKNEIASANLDATNTSAQKQAGALLGTMDLFAQMEVNKQKEKEKQEAKRAARKAKEDAEQKAKGDEGEEVYEYEDEESAEGDVE
ncbi:hypothetical protein SS50377_27097 [Spironucleus salmonicida]|uniref:Uncharacterized protein n=1 Tax=Spironucleus salmonicida TaxID=348837 RepID=V6LJA3_9EUKA|nr:hypothetical protein SS50377_27097 [Spironucleus salmonicida]|eukprot:EST43776.1 Hypothetical protein SS50377_16517 [Spironucleus salmonicida]